MYTIDLKKLRATLPKNGKIKVKKKNSTKGDYWAIECKVERPSLSESPAT